MKRIDITPGAESDLDDIFGWISIDDPDAAARHVHGLVAATWRLATYSESGPARPNLAGGARSLTVGRYLILYRIVGEVVEVVRFVHGSRDLGGLFEG